MKSIFNAADSAEFIARIDKLTPSTPALWGKMNASQMLAHYHLFLKIAIGDLKFKRAFIGLLFGKIAKKKILQDEFLQKNLPTIKEAVVKDERNFEEEKAALETLIRRAQKAGLEGLVKGSHPFFGKLTSEEWDQLSTRHLDHHLRQFGV